MHHDMTQACVEKEEINIFDTLNYICQYLSDCEKRMLKGEFIQAYQSLKSARHIVRTNINKIERDTIIEVEDE